MKGLGIYKWQDGRVYAGERTDNVMDGMGYEAWTDGRVYEG